MQNGALSPVQRAINVYIKSAGGSYTQLDTMLVRQYPDRFRADAVGLKAGSYTMKDRAGDRRQGRCLQGRRRPRS